uniref:hypothetical protein n=1 Tax=Jeotgalibaca porci TaxID=1868793 RepID=UPI0035A10C6B
MNKSSLDEYSSIINDLGNVKKWFDQSEKLIKSGDELAGGLFKIKASEEFERFMYKYQMFAEASELFDDISKEIIT